MDSGLVGEHISRDYGMSPISSEPSNPCFVEYPILKTLGLNYGGFNPTRIPECHIQGHPA